MYVPQDSAGTLANDWFSVQGHNLDDLKMPVSFQLTGIGYQIGFQNTSYFAEKIIGSVSAMVSYVSEL